jgi:hypothetical protein
MTVPELPSAEATVARLRGPLLGELRDAAPRRRARRSLRLLALAVAAAAVALVALPSRSSPALAVERHDDVIELRIADATASPETLTRELRDAGIPGEVRVVAVPPDLVGTWAAIAESAPLDPPLDGKNDVRLGRVEYGRDTVRVSADAVRDADGTFTFFAGRAAREGEPYDFDGKTFRPGIFDR